jgi:hypothetical protein
MLLALLKLLHDMILLGFVPSGAYQARPPSNVAPHRRSTNLWQHSLGYEQLADDTEEWAAEPPPLEPGTAPTVRHFVSLLLRVVDGRHDRMDEPGNGAEADPDKINGDDEAVANSPFGKGDLRRYERVVSITHDTDVIMQCKVWACKVLQVI